MTAAPAPAPHRARATLGVIAVGGALGACARYAAGLAWPTEPDGFPWTTLVVNAVGCAVIGVFLVVVTEAWAAPPLVRPFFGTGVLGGFTTFSTYAVDAQRLLDGGHAATALGYLAATLGAALLSVWAGAAAARRAIGRRAAR
ncbi:fluoride efflux transporter CrcB [Kitasatospora phosalacinea]|uniref:fluoride efflux transporter CrcB n=1 Tax=Kitasatospora phosalacinea TaxID=2065 RepID=UPI00068A313A|nr:fluoride efflux transporter CrcB [Kitasatospora phosalacinea]